MYPFERFTERAKKVLALAQQEAEAAQHGYIGTEHLLVALLREAEGLAALVLGNLGVTIDATREAIRAALSRQAGPPRQSPVMPTARVKRVVEISFEEARRMGHNYVGTEHLLLGLMVEGEGVAAHVLADLGVTLERAQAEIDRVLESGPPPGRRQQPRPPGGPPPSPKVQEILARAWALAGEAGASEVGPEHLEQAIAEWRAGQP